MAAVNEAPNEFANQRKRVEQAILERIKVCEGGEQGFW